MLKIKNVYKVFNANTINENKVFDGFSLDVEKGEYVSIIGSNGAGKSTLLNLISGNIQVDSGSIIIDGENVAKKEEYYRCRYIGRVFQNPTIGVAPNMNILENMSLADNKGKPYGIKFAIDKKRINYYREELKKLNLGLEDKLYNKVNLLSGGQRQALSLIMAVMSNPKILLLDEHTAALDPKTSIKIMDITNKIIEEKKITTLMVTHDINQAIETGNRLIMMHEGKVVIDVKTEEKSKLNRDRVIEMFGKTNIE
ncbi:MAG: ATP-binding cassette domain-containing protein, partial [Clostridium sp.]|nr:ATP-binding cassette domain-containing protein [Clostridium sp.]